MDTSKPTTSVIRKDVRRNRASLLTAARAAMSERGLGAPLEDIARRAGVGIATLYRHFPNRDALIEAIMTDEFGAFTHAAEEGLALTDPWEGFCHYLWRLGEIQAAEGHMREFLGGYIPASPTLRQLHHSLMDLIRQLVERAQWAGALRPDVVAEDTAFVAWTNAQVMAATQQVAPEVWRRALGLMIDGFRADAAHPLPGRRLDENDLLSGLGHLRSRRG